MAVGIGVGVEAMVGVAVGTGAGGGGAGVGVGAPIGTQLVPTGLVPLGHVTADEGGVGSGGGAHVPAHDATGSGAAVADGQPVYAMGPLAASAIRQGRKRSADPPPAVMRTW